MGTDLATDAVTILVVDDDEVDVRALRRALRREGVTNSIEVARNGLEGLERLRGTATRAPLPWPYVVLLDLNMPRMNGIEFLQELRLDAALHGTVVFVLTTSNDDRDKVAAYRHHIAGYLLKSGMGEDFAHMIRLLQEFVVTVRFPDLAPVPA